MIFSWTDWLLRGLLTAARTCSLPMDSSRDGLEMAKTETLNVRYRHFKDWSTVPEQWYPMLKRLSLGHNGNMLYLVEDEVGKNIVVATVARKPVGWCATDYDGKVNLYVAKAYRGLKIASKLAEVWCDKSRAAIRKNHAWDCNRDGCYCGEELTWTDEASKLIANAIRKLNIVARPVRRKKFKAVRHTIVA